MTEGTGRPNVTVLGCAIAEGNVLPPLIAFKRRNLWSTWRGCEETGIIQGTFFGVFSTGWMTTEVFKDWFNWFAQNVKERPLLLHFVIHMFHVNLHFIKKARSETYQ